METIKILQGGCKKARKNGTHPYSILLDYVKTMRRYENMPNEWQKYYTSLDHAYLDLARCLIINVGHIYSKGITTELKQQVAQNLKTIVKSNFAR